MATKVPKLPREIYVSWEGEGNDQYLNAHKELDATLDKPGEQKRVGVYEFKEYADVEASVTVKRVSAKKRARPKAAARKTPRSTPAVGGTPS